ncbi:MAG TPA: alpha/beta hydrolase [Candidatus Acidoferrales bacterium]|nr:alpha/beta hydrolase [Candidatus Acidoferrales bacterium]
MDSLRVRVAAVMLRCVTWGDADDPPVVLLHGAGAHAHWWDALVPHLLPGWRIIAPDLRGHGESDWARQPYLIEDFYDDLCGLLDALALNRVVLIGHSMGGRVAAWYAAHQAERVRGLALLDTRMAGLKPDRIDRWRGINIGGGPRRVYPTRAEALAAFRVIPPEPGIAADLLAALAAHAVVQLSPAEWALRFDRSVLRLEGSRLADIFDLLPRIHCPAVVMEGAASTVTTPAECAATAAALGNCPVHMFSGGHHFLLAQPAAVGAALRAFLDRLQPVNP